MVVFKDSAREFVLLALSNELLSSLHSSSFSSLTSSSLSSRERRASSLDFVAHTGARNRTALESLFFLFVLSLCVLKTRKSTRTRITTETRTRTKRRSICVADEEDGKEESVMTPTTRENNGEEGGEGDENTSSFYGEVSNKCPIFFLFASKYVLFSNVIGANKGTLPVTVIPYPRKP